MAIDSLRACRQVPAMSDGPACCRCRLRCWWRAPFFTHTVRPVEYTGLTDDEWMAAQEGAFQAVLRGGRYPTMARMAADPDVELDLDSMFEFGLCRLLDGYAAAIARLTP